MNTDASILVYIFRPERTGFNMYAEYTQPQLTFLTLVPWSQSTFRNYFLQTIQTKNKWTISYHKNTSGLITNNCCGL